MKQSGMNLCMQVLMLLILSILQGSIFASSTDSIHTDAVKQKKSEQPVLLATGEGIAINAIRTGDQVVINDMDKAIEFAGHTVKLSGFSGLLGLSSDAAYVLVAKGQAGIKDLQAEAGEILIILPYGLKVSKQSYDAAKLVEFWPEPAQLTRPDVFQNLKQIEKKQARAIYYGRYERTVFNLAAPGSVDVEMARRSVVGENAVQDIRFSGEKNPEKIERMTIDKFSQALLDGDTKTIAALMDPTPYGGADLRGGAIEARQLAASMLIKKYKWSVLLGSDEPAKEDIGWRIGQVSITTKAVNSFIYVSRVNVGESK